MIKITLNNVQYQNVYPYLIVGKIEGINVQLTMKWANFKMG